jgi:signal transduction histidine kinase
MKRSGWWRSLQARLAIGGLLWVCLGVTLSGAAIFELIDAQVTEQFQHEVTDHMRELQGLYLSSTSPDGLARPLSDPRFQSPESGFYWQIWRGGAPVLRSVSLLGRDMLLPEDAAPQDRARVQGLGQNLIFASQEIEAPSQGGRAVVAVGIDERQQQAVMSAFQRPLFASLVAVALGLAAAASAQVVFGLRPLRRMRAALADVRAGKAETLPEDFPSEVQPLVSDLNDVIRFNREMIQRARAQAGNLAHALRTPLTILSGEADRLAREGKPEAAAAILQECRVMRRQIDHQIARARAAANRTIAGPQVRAAPLIGEVVGAVGRLHADRGVVFANDVDADIEVDCDPNDLQEILGNLLDNAGKWARSEVRITGHADTRAVEFAVEDDGPGVPEAERAKVFGIGERLDERPSGGGLGLAIVRDLVDLYDGTIRLEQGGLGGLRAVVRLPRPG